MKNKIKAAAIVMMIVGMWILLVEMLTDKTIAIGLLGVCLVVALYYLYKLILMTLEDEQ